MSLTVLFRSRTTGTTYTAPVSGGIQTGGSATIARRVVRTVPLSGGLIQTGGTAPKALVQDVLPAGGIQLGGTAPVSRVKAAPVSGGILTGGTTLKALAKAPATSGGLITSGAAVTLRQAAGLNTYTYAPSGGLVMGGSAATSLLVAQVQVQGGGWPRQSVRPSVERITRAEEPRRSFGRPDNDIVSRFLAKSREYRGKGSISVCGKQPAKLKAASPTAFVSAPIEPSTFEAVGSGSVRVRVWSETFYYDPYLLARLEDLDLLSIG